MMSEKQPHISDMAERVATAMAGVNGSDWNAYHLARVSLEASHHAEMVEALRLAAKRLSQAGVGGAGRSTIKGWADETFAFLAKIGGDA